MVHADSSPRRPRAVGNVSETAVPKRSAPHPRGPSSDQVYLKLASQIPGLTITDPKVAIATGHAMCTGLQYGESPADAAAATASNTGTTRAQAEAAVNAAITAYCPQYRR